MSNDFGVEDPCFREALYNALKSRDTKTVFFLDILGAEAWANPIFRSYLYKQISPYIKRNYSNIWNLEIQDKDDLIRKKLREKIEERISQYVDVDDVMPDYNSGGTADLHIVRILSWEDDDMKSHVAQDLIDFHRTFNIPLFYIPKGYLDVLLGNRRVEFHLALDKQGNPIPSGCWVYDKRQRTRKPYDERIHDLGREPRIIIERILESDDCIFALEKRRQLLNEEAGTKRRVLVINSPTRDKGGFRGSPTSLLYAIGPLIEEIKAKKINIAGFSHLNIFDPTHYSDEVHTQLTETLNKINPDIVMISTTSDAFHVAVEMAKLVKNWRKNAIVILGGPHCDEVDLQAEDETNRLNNPLLRSNSFDFVISGDGEYMLLTLVRMIVNEMQELTNNRQPISVDAIKTCINKKADDFRGAKGKATLYFKLNGKIIKIESSMSNIDLDMIPPLRYEYLKKDHLKDFSIFKNEKGEVKKCVQVMTHRGCSGDCNFCSEKAPLNRPKTTDPIVKAIQDYVDKLGVEAIFFDDSTFIEDRNFVSELCDKMIASGLSKRIKWGCLNRFDRVDEGLVKKMVEAGLDYMYLGLELYDDRSLILMNKGTRVRKQIIKDVLKVLNDNNVRVGVSILFGYPGVSEEIEKETIKFVGKMIKEKKIQLLSLSLFNYHLSSNLTNLHRRQLRLNYFSDKNRIRRQNKSPWNCFEEGGWFHDDSRRIDEEYLARILWEVDKWIANKEVLVRKKEIEDFIDSSWGKRLLEEPKCFNLLNSKLKNPVCLSNYKVDGLEDYVRYDEEQRDELTNICKEIFDNLENRSPQFWLFWGKPGSGKTSFVTSIGKVVEQRKMTFKNVKLDDLKITSDEIILGFRELVTKGTALCFIDEIQSRPEACRIIKSFIDQIEQNNLPITVIIAGSKGDSINELIEHIKSCENGRDLISRIPNANRRSIREMSIGDRIIIALSGIRRKSNRIKAVEKLALHWIALSPSLRDARQIIECVASAVERVPSQECRLMYDHLFSEFSASEKERFKKKIPSTNLQKLMGEFLGISD